MFELTANSTQIPLIDPPAVISAMERIGVDSSIIKKCNSLELKHGPTPGRCHFLVSKSDFDDLANEAGGSSGTINTSYFYPNITVKIRDNFNSGASYDYAKWTLAEAVNVLGHPDNPDSVVYIILEDIRHFLSKTYTENKIYNKLRHTQKNVGVTAGTERYYQDSLNGSSPWNVDDMFSDMTTYTAYPFSWTTSSFLQNYYLLNVISGDETLLNWFSRASEIFRCYYYVNKDGELVFEGNQFQDSDVSSGYMITQMKNLVVAPYNTSTPIDKLKFPISFITAESLEGKHLNNESDIALPGYLNKYPDRYYQDSDTSGGTFSAQQANLPHHYYNLPNSSYWTSYIMGDVTERIRASINPRMSYRKLRGYFAYTPKFEADRVIYANYGQGLATEIYGDSQHELNYWTPAFKDYEKELVREKWKYTLKTKFTYPEGYSYGYAAADIFYPILGTPRRTGVVIYDLTKSLSNLTVGSSGVCNQVGAYYYAECCGLIPSSSQSGYGFSDSGTGSGQGSSSIPLQYDSSSSSSSLSYSSSSINPTPICDGSCFFSWQNVGGTWQWVLVSQNCTEGCACDPPPYNGLFENEIAYQVCTVFE